MELNHLNVIMRKFLEISKSHKKVFTIPYCLRQINLIFDRLLFHIKFILSAIRNYSGILLAKYYFQPSTVLTKTHNTTKNIKQYRKIWRFFLDPFIRKETPLQLTIRYQSITTRGLRKYKYNLYSRKNIIPKKLDQVGMF